MTSERPGAPYSRRYGQELVSKPAISLKKSWWGYRTTTPGRDLVWKPAILKKKKS